MTRKLECPVLKFSGSILLPDYLNYAQMVTWEESQRRAAAMLRVENGAAVGFADGYGLADLRAAKIPAILAIVSEWNLCNMPAHPTLETFPATPAKSAARLYEWITAEISKLYAEEETEIPNA